ncbi:MAG: protease modulator HflC [Lachnospiraceae bacterium]|nr:protease modulator HflC [Robinsoniella sp.]MDY3766970.1 protease modulator HflC [Lachnospiraceae bacterium]
MKTKQKLITAVVGAVAVCIIGSSSIVITAEDEYKLVRQFGKVNHVIDEAGISFKIPFIQSADTLPRKILLFDLEPSDVITKDKKTMITDCYALWTIEDPLKFAQTLNSSVSNAEGRLNTAIYNATKNVISNMNQDEVITSRDGELQEAILKHIGTSLESYGIHLIEVETKRLDLPSDNKDSVYERMISERDNMAATYKAQGEAEAQVIRNSTDKEVELLLSDAEKNSEIIRAEGEAEYMKILAEAYSDDDRKEFYTFVRSLDALKASVTGEDKTIILDENSPITQIFYQ